MKTQLPAGFSGLVTVYDGHATTNTLIVAEQFGKQHRDVMRAISKLECSAEFNARNFARISYYDSCGRKQEAFEITRDGFMFLAMGFTGSKAAQLKEAFIDAFNQLEQRLHAQESGNVSALRDLVLTGNPLWANLVRYQQMGLSLGEMGTLVGKSGEAVRHHLRRLAEAGLVDYSPDPALSARGRKAQRVRQDSQLDLGLQEQAEAPAGRGFNLPAVAEFLRNSNRKPEGAQ